MNKGIQLAIGSAAAAMLVLAAGCSEPCTLPLHNSEKLAFYMVNVGQGDASLLLAPNGDRMLIDAGEPDPARDSLLPLMAEVIGEPAPFDVVIATHYHYDHVGGMSIMAEEGWLSDETVFYDPGERLDEAAHVYSRYESSTCGEECRITPEPGDIISFGGEDITVTVLAVDGKIYEGGTSLDSSPNGRSLSVMISWNDFDLFTGGDLTTAVAEPLADLGVLEGTDVYRANHHGSNDGNTHHILRALSPQVVLASLGNAEGCGPGYNPYGHPGQGFLDAMIALDPQPKLYQTETGGRAVGSDGCRVQSWDPGHRSYGDLSANTDGGHVLVQTDSTTFTVIPECGRPEVFTAR